MTGSNKSPRKMSKTNPSKPNPYASPRPIVLHHLKNQSPIYENQLLNTSGVSSMSF
jgi:hypothetical protein